MSKTIHIIDDDLDFVFLLTHLLHNKGYEVTSDTKGEIHQLDNADHPVLILINMDRGDDQQMEICKGIKKQYPHIPLIVISADVQLKIIADQCESDRFILKPFSYTSILSTIDSVLV